MPPLRPSVPAGAAPAVTLRRRLTIPLEGEIHVEGTPIVQGVFEGDIVREGTLQAGAAS
jgi:hypothetical protein